MPRRAHPTSPSRSVRAADLTDRSAQPPGAVQHRKPAAKQRKRLASTSTIEAVLDRDDRRSYTVKPDFSSTHGSGSSAA